MMRTVHGVNDFQIYSLINRITKKKYIGKTCLSLSVRLSSGYQEGTKIKEAINEYGLSNFDKAIIERGLTKKEADERERYWIKEENTLYPNGYNLESGGTHNEVHPLTLEKIRKSRIPLMKEVLQYSLDGKLLHTYSSLHEAEKETGIDKRNISNVCHGRFKTTGGFIWKYAE